jgi:hypothetical protein
VATSNLAVIMHPVKILLPQTILEEDEEGIAIIFDGVPAQLHPLSVDINGATVTNFPRVITYLKSKMRIKRYSLQPIFLV